MNIKQITVPFILLSYSLAMEWQQESESADHITLTVRKQRKMNACLLILGLPSLFYIVQGPLPKGMISPTIRMDLPTSMNIIKIIPDTRHGGAYL